METIATKLKDKLFITGLVLILGSLFFFCIPFLLPVSGNDNFGLFIPNFAITVIYFIILLVSKRLKHGREGLFPFFAFLVLFLISAYSLNREMEVFEKAVPWFIVLQVLLCLNYLAFAFFETFPRWLQHCMMFLLGIAFVTFLYMSCYLAPLYVFG